MDGQKVGAQVLKIRIQSHILLTSEKKVCQDFLQ